jgi:hypothetical protein
VGWTVTKTKGTSQRLTAEVRPATSGIAAAEETNNGTSFSRNQQKQKQYGQQQVMSFREKLQKTCQNGVNFVKKTQNE